MAITTQERTNILKLTAGLFNAAPGASNLADFVSVYEANGHNLQALALTLGNSGPFNTMYPSYQTASEFAAKFLATLGLQGNTEAVDFITAKFNAGEAKAQIMYDALVAINGTSSPDFAGAKAILANKAAVAEYYSVTLGASSDSLEALQGTLNGVTADAASVDAANQVNAGGNGVGGGFTLTQRADNLTGNAADNVFLAPVTQNETGSGELANTFETGDVLNGGGGRNILKADLIQTGTVQDGNGSAVIAATTSNIQEVYLRAQRSHANLDNTIDAEKMAGVEQWWTDNSRANITIEDIRTDTSATTFGMRLTDPGVSFNNYFNALFLEGDVSATSAVTLNIYEGPLGSPNAVTQLANISVREINFQVAGQTFTLASDAMKAANTWDELEVAIKAELAKIEGAETITVINRGNGQFVLEDSIGREFQVNDGEALVLAVTNNVTVTNSLNVGRDEVAGPVISNAVLDGAGNGSQGGDLNLGAMSGLRGVEELNLSVDRDSHVRTITSFNQTPGQYNLLRNGEANEFLEVVNVTSLAGKGDLTVGRSSDRLDGRVQNWADSTVDGIVDGGFFTAPVAPALPVFVPVAGSGFVNIREFNAATFEGALNVAITLDNNVVGRYLDDATEAVTFSYTAGTQNDIFNIADISTLGVSADQDFAMNVDMGAGDDRLVINVPAVRAVSVDGGLGENSIVVAQSHGTTALNTFKAFANFQTYEVEGTGVAGNGVGSVRNDTTHNFTSMTGVKNVVIATNDGPAAAGPPALPRGDNTTLVNLAADQNVTITGKNQTIGNRSTADQFFGNITLTNDAGADRTITLENTARLANSTNGVRIDGVLTVDNLTINTTPATAVGATKNVTIESEGARNTANVIAGFNGRDVEKLTLTGTQALTLIVNEIANQASNAAPGTNTSTSVQINAAGLTGELNLAVNGTMLNNFGATAPVPAQIDTIVGTAGANDTLMFHGALNPGNAVTASGFESVQLGSFNTTMYGDIATGDLNASGVLNTAGLGVNKFEVANLNAALTLTNLSGGATVDLGDANRDAAGSRVLSQTLAEQINLQSSATNASSTASTVTINRLDVVVTGSTSNIAVGDAVAGVAANTNGFRTINLNIARDANLAATPAIPDVNLINLDVGSQARTLDVNGGVAGRSNVGFQAAQVAAAETQTVDFATLAATAAGNITVGGVSVALLAGDNDAAIATKVAAALNAVPAGTDIGDATYTAAGAVVTAVFTAASGNVPDAILATVDGTAAIGGTSVNTTTIPGVTGNVGSAQVADIVDFTVGGNVLDNSLEVIDLSGYNGQVVLTMESVVTGTQTDVSFVMSAYSANITLTDMGGAAGAIALITHNSVFDFNAAGSVQVPSVWTIDNIVNDGAPSSGVNNNTLFDLRDLGIANYAQVEILYVADGTVATDLAGNALAAGSAVIRSEAQGNDGVETWEIIVTAADGVALTGVGVGPNSLTSDNFVF